MRNRVYTNIPNRILLFTITSLCKNDTGALPGAPSLNTPSWTSNPASRYLTNLVSIFWHEFSIKVKGFPSSPSTHGLLIHSAAQKTFIEGLPYIPGSVMGPGDKQEGVFDFKEPNV